MTSVITIEQAMQHMRVIDEMEDENDLIQGKIDAAQGMVENYLGGTLAELFPSPAAIPAPITEAILQLTAFLYDNREAAVIDSRVALIDPSPGFYDMLKPYRVWSF